MQKIGILLPRSTYYSTIGFDILEGVRVGLKDLKRDDIEIVIDNVGFGTDQQECYRITERLLMQENVPVVFAYISHRTAQLLRPLFLAANKVLIVLDSGANLPQEWPGSTNTLYHSLNNSLGCWLGAEEAINDGFKKAALVSGYYDGGYLHTHATFKGYSEAGGVVVYNYATGYTRDDFNMAPLKDWYSGQNDVCLLSLFSGDFVQWYFEELNKHFNEVKPRVYLPPFALEEMMLEETPFPGQKIKGIAAWYKENELPENTRFRNAMEESGKKANLFSLLGWESATLGAKALDLLKENKQNGKEVCSQLLGFSFTSPRGPVFFHQKSKTSLAPLYTSSIVANENDRCSLKVTGKVSEDHLLNAYEKMINLPLENAVSGWFNSYTCI